MKNNKLKWAFALTSIVGAGFAGVVPAARLTGEDGNLLVSLISLCFVAEAIFFCITLWQTVSHKFAIGTAVLSVVAFAAVFAAVYYGLI